MRFSFLFLAVLLVGCGGGEGGGSEGGGNIPLKRAFWEQRLLYADGSNMPSSDLQGFWIYVKTDNTFLDNDTVSDAVGISSVLTGVDHSTGTAKMNCQYDLRNAYYKNNLNPTDDYFVTIRSVSISGSISSFSPSSRPFSFSDR